MSNFYFLLGVCDCVLFKAEHVHHMKSLGRCERKTFPLKLGDTVCVIYRLLVFVWLEEE